MKLRLKPLLGGIATEFFPPLAKALGRRNQPHVTANYYYTVWLRHVCTAAHHQSWNAPATVLEIGPGQALGTGLAALLSGVNQYVAFDASTWLPQRFDEQMWQEMVRLFQTRASFATTDRILSSTLFPDQLFPTEQLARSLSDESLARIKRSVQQRTDLISYSNDAATLPDNAVDYLFSHSVLEHVEPLDALYRTMWRWLKPGGVMTHSIDFTAHGTSQLWNGHWTVPDFVWRLMQGKRSYFLNREPASTHRTLLTKQGFEIKGFHLLQRASELQLNDLALRFRSFSETDLTTEAAFVVARKPL